MQKTLPRMGATKKRSGPVSFLAEAHRPVDALLFQLPAPAVARLRGFHREVENACDSRDRSAIHLGSPSGSVGRPRAVEPIDDDYRTGASPAIRIERVASRPRGCRFTIHDRRTRHGPREGNTKPTASGQPRLSLRSAQLGLSTHRFFWVVATAHLFLVEPHLGCCCNFSRCDSSAETHRRTILRRSLRLGGHRHQHNQQRHCDWQPFHGQILPSVPLQYPTSIFRSAQ